MQIYLHIRGLLVSLMIPELLGREGEREREREREGEREREREREQ